MLRRPRFSQRARIDIASEEIAGRAIGGAREELAIAAREIENQRAITREMLGDVAGEGNGGEKLGLALEMGVGGGIENRLEGGRRDRGAEFWHKKSGSQAECSVFHGRNSEFARPGVVLKRAASRSGDQVRECNRRGKPSLRSQF